MSAPNKPEVLLATFSACGKYRYHLARRWHRGDRTLTFVMLNPSTADDNVDDQTIRRCVRFAQGEGYDALSVVNLFAYRATDPDELRGDPSVGPENDAAIRATTQDATTVVVAWGCRGDRWKKRVEYVVGLIQRPLLCLGTTRSGQPRHPMLVPASQRLLPWDYSAAMGRFNRTISSNVTL